MSGRHFSTCSSPITRASRGIPVLTSPARIGTPSGRRRRPPSLPSLSPHLGRRPSPESFVRWAGRHIPTGFRRDFTPGIPGEAQALIDERDRLLSRDPFNPQIPNLNHRLTETINDFRRSRWVANLGRSDHRSNIKHFWRTLRSLSGKSARPPPNLPISFGNRTHTKPAAIARRLNRQFTSIVPYTSDPSTRVLKRKFRRLDIRAAGLPTFSASQVASAVAASGNSTTAGPDHLTILHLKHLGHRGFAFLAEIFNLSIRSANIPALWKTADIPPWEEPPRHPWYLLSPHLPPVPGS